MVDAYVRVKTVDKYQKIGYVRHDLYLKGRKKVARAWMRTSKKRNRRSARVVVDAEVSRAGELSAEVQDAHRMLKYLIRTHPHREIREDLSGLIQRREVGLMFDDQFLSSSNVLAALVWMRMPTKGDSLILVLSPEELTSTVVDRTLKQLVIYHEWIHVKQQRSGRYPKHCASIQMGKLSKGEASLLFEADCEAYEAESILALQLGAARLHGIFREYESGGRRALRLQVARELSARPLLSQYRAHFKSLALAGA